MAMADWTGNGRYRLVVSLLLLLIGGVGTAVVLLITVMVDNAKLGTRLDAHEAQKAHGQVLELIATMQQDLALIKYRLDAAQNLHDIPPSLRSAPP